MVAGCGMTCIKYVVFFVNFLFFVMGCAAVGLGIWALVSDDNMEALTKIDKDGKAEDFNAIGLLQSGAIVLLVGGGVLVVLGFLGCCGAVKEVKCLLALYAGIVVLIIIVEITAAALAIAFQSDAEDYLQSGLKKGILNYYDGNLTSDNPFSRAIDVAQVEFMCCGVTNYTDFEGSPWWKASRADTPLPYVPKTCCELKNRDDFFDHNKVNLTDVTCPTTKPPGKSNPYTGTSCYDSILARIKQYAAVIIGVAFAIVAIEILAVVFACCLYRSIDD